jgi:hypothetical protein
MKTRERRLIYVSDPSLIASRYLPDPVKEEDLRNWIDDVSASRVDTFIQEVFTQGWTTYWRADGFDYDARHQHRSFLPLLVPASSRSRSCSTNAANASWRL